jgi:hypothetical protein
MTHRLAHDPAMFTSDRTVRGEMAGHNAPNWDPLLELAPDHIDDFMWMFEVLLESGLRLHAYKHWETRKYLHLDTEGRAFAYLPRSYKEDEPSAYREVDPRLILREVLRRRDE